MRRFGETLVVHFGEEERVAGYSMVQLIETSLISAHFANLTNTVYLDVFSCKPYDPDVVADFAKQFFGGKRCVTQVSFRR
jgi:S-adenosylmethionine/arginine decarboxylase-like enzyme